MKTALLFALLCVNVLSATIPAASTAYSDVVLALAACAQNGDTIQLPTGTSNWTNTLTTTKNITLLGNGTNNTVLIDEITNPAYVGDFVFFTGTGFVRVASIQFRRGLRATASALGSLTFGQNLFNYRVDHCYFNDTKNGWVRSYCLRGLIDSNRGIVVNLMDPSAITPYFSGSGSPGGTYGDISWSTALTLGTTNAVYIESNSFESYAPGSLNAFTDGYGGARFVVRSNYFLNARLDFHGTQSTGRQRGVRQWEFYNNVFNDVILSPSQMMDMRSGTGVIWGNTGSAGYTSLATASDFRQVQTYTFVGTQPNLGGFWGANGTNAWDKNLAGGPFESGTHTGAPNATTLQDTTKNWTPNQWVGYTLWCMNQFSKIETNTHKFMVITANTTNTMTYPQQNLEAPTLLQWQPGQSYQIWKVTNSLDHIGSGTCDLLTGDFPTPVDLHQIIDPAYAWNNSILGNTNVGIITGYPASEISGRDFINQAVRPGYVPLVYPHPLAGNPAPNVSFTATPSAIRSGGSSVLNWAILNGDYSTLDGVAIPATGSSNITLTVSQTYTIISTNASGTTTFPLTVYVIPEMDFTVLPASITFGNSVTRTWHTTNATTVTLDGVAVAASGTNTVSPAVTTAYVLLASNGGGSTNSSQTVTVTATPPPTAGSILMARRMLLR